MTMFVPKLITELKSYNREKAVSDIFAGLTVGVVALPLAMAFAIASDLPPERGIFTAIVAGFIISVLGGSKVQIGGPTGAFVVLVSSVLAQFGYEGLALCTIIAGVFLLLFGLFRLGGMIKFIPFPVTVGFTAGIAVVILSTQIRDLLGLTMTEVPSEFLDKWRTYLNHLSTINWQATTLGLGTVVMIVIIRRYLPKIPAMLAAMLAATLAAYFLHLEVETIGSRFGELPRMLPSPCFPAFDLEHIGPLVKPAFTIALLAAIESLLSATVADGMIGGRHRPNMELIGQGVANIVSIIFGGIPATGAIARTATNVKSGARTPVAGIIHAITLLLLLMLLAPFAKLIPLAALAGILVVVSYNMSEIRHFATIIRGPRSDALVLVLTFLLTVIVDLTVAVQVGVVLASFLFIRRMSEIANVGMITREIQGDDNGKEDPNALALREVPDQVEVFEVNGPFFFGMIDTFKNAVRGMEKDVKVLIIRMRDVLAVDGTALHVLRELHTRCNKDNIHLVFSGVHTQPLIAFEQSGFLKEVGIENCQGNIDDALNRARTLLGLPTIELHRPFVPTVSREAKGQKTFPD